MEGFWQYGPCGFHGERRQERGFSSVERIATNENQGEFQLFLGGVDFSDVAKIAGAVTACHNCGYRTPAYSVTFEGPISGRGLPFRRMCVLFEVRDAGNIAQDSPGDPLRQSQHSRQLREIAGFPSCERYLNLPVFGHHGVRIPVKLPTTT